MIIALISKEASQEVVMDDLIPLLSKYSKNLPELERKLVDSFYNIFYKYRLITRCQQWFHLEFHWEQSKKL